VYCNKRFNTRVLYAGTAARSGRRFEGRLFVAVTSESGGDIAHGEIVENELDRLIRKRHDRRVAEEGERPERVAWTESERRYDARRRAENRAAWYGWHMDQAERHRRNLAALVAQHEAAAERLMQATDERRTA
jgi:hypothetical protein